jgi:hypothetical protein
LIEELRPVELELAAEFGDFALFALFETEDSLFNRYDLYVAAPWLNADYALCVRISEMIQARLSFTDFLRVQRIIDVPVAHPDFSKELRYYPTAGCVVEIYHRQLFEKWVARGCIITCRPDLMPVPGRAENEADAPGRVRPSRSADSAPSPALRKVPGR